MRWVEVAVEADEGSADVVSEIMISEGCGGTAAARASSESDSSRLQVFCYLPVTDRLEDAIHRIGSRIDRLPDYGFDLRSTQLRLRWIEDADWASAWREFFKPIKIGRIVVKPSWEDYEPGPEEIIVELDAGMAFGTGNHASTKLCLLALQGCVMGGETVLDFGTGSGILAIAAAKLGASMVVGLDNDPIAVETARKNVCAAGLADRIRVDEAESPLAFDGLADVAVANIVPNVIIPLAPSLRLKAKHGGTVITSGIVLERAEEVEAALEASCLATVQRHVDGDWVAFVSRAD